MTHQVDEDAYGHALSAAQTLQQLLEQRLTGRRASAWSCGQGASGAGQSEVIGINIPLSQRHQIGLFTLWTCQMRDNSGISWTCGINTFIPLKELYALFRTHFAGIAIPVAHPGAQLYYEQPSSYLNFTPSGRTVTINDDNPAFVRPSRDTATPAWDSAEIRCDGQLPGYLSANPKIACNINPSGYGQKRGRAAGQYYEIPTPRKLATFYVHLPADGHGPDVFLPIARIIGRDGITGSATIELDQSVEFLTHDGDISIV